MNEHGFVASPENPDECVFCGETADAAIHELDGIPFGLPKDEEQE